MPDAKYAVFLLLAVASSLLCPSCRNGTETARNDELSDSQREALIGQPQICGGCDPHCSFVIDAPTGRDLHDGNSDHIRYDLDRDGIVLSFETNGRYSRRHDSLIACESRLGLEVIWSQLYWDDETPDGTEISFMARTASTAPDLDDASWITLATSPRDGEPADIQGTLAAMGVPNGFRYLDVVAELSSLDGESSPVFQSMSLVYYCVCTCDTDEDCTPVCPCDMDC